MKHLSYQNEALELSESELSHVVQERAEGPKAPSPGQRPGYNNIFSKAPLQGDRFATIKNPGRCPGLGASALFRAYGENLSELELYITLG